MEYVLVLMLAGEPQTVAHYANARACNDALIERVAALDAPEYACRRADGTRDPVGPVNYVYGYGKMPGPVVTFRIQRMW